MACLNRSDGFRQINPLISPPTNHFQPQEYNKKSHSVEKFSPHKNGTNPLHNVGNIKVIVIGNFLLFPPNLTTLEIKVLCCLFLLRKLSIQATSCPNMHIKCSCRFCANYLACLDHIVLFCLVLENFPYLGILYAAGTIGSFYCRYISSIFNEILPCPPIHLHFKTIFSDR